MLYVFLFRMLWVRSMFARIPTQLSAPSMFAWVLSPLILLSELHNVRGCSAAPRAALPHCSTCALGRMGGRRGPSGASAAAGAGARVQWMTFCLYDYHGSIHRVYNHDPLYSFREHPVTITMDFSVQELRPAARRGGCCVPRAPRAHLLLLRSGGARGVRGAWAGLGCRILGGM
jgi:hypothetical protein